MFDAIEALERVRLACLSGDSIPEDLQDWLADAFGRFLDHKSGNLDDAFGLTQGRGGVPWWLARGIAERDEALRTLAAIHFADRPVSSTARRIRQMAVRYETVAWPRDSRLDHMPVRYHGSETEWLWRAFRSGARMPLSERHLRNLLAAPPRPEMAIFAQANCHTRGVPETFSGKSASYQSIRNGGGNVHY